MAAVLVNGITRVSVAVVALVVMAVFQKEGFIRITSCTDDKRYRNMAAQVSLCRAV